MSPPVAASSIANLPRDIYHKSNFPVTNSPLLICFYMSRAIKDTRKKRQSLRLAPPGERPANGGPAAFLSRFRKCSGLFPCEIPDIEILPPSWITAAIDWFLQIFSPSVQAPFRGSGSIFSLPQPVGTHAGSVCFLYSALLYSIPLNNIYEYINIYICVYIHMCVCVC